MKKITIFLMTILFVFSFYVPSLTGITPSSVLLDNIPANFGVFAHLNVKKLFSEVRIDELENVVFSQLSLIMPENAKKII